MSKIHTLTSTLALMVGIWASASQAGHAISIGRSKIGKVLELNHTQADANPLQDANLYTPTTIDTISPPLPPYHINRQQGRRNDMKLFLDEEGNQHTLQLTLDKIIIDHISYTMDCRRGLTRYTLHIQNVIEDPTNPNKIRTYMIRVPRGEKFDPSKNYDTGIYHFWCSKLADVLSNLLKKGKYIENKLLGEIEISTDIKK